MAVVTTDFLAGVMTEFRAIWADAFLAALGPTFYPRVAMEIPSNTLTETYNWLGDVPVMREWVDERQHGGLASYNYSLTNRHYESSIEVDRDTFEDDRLGMIAPRIKQLGMEVPRFIENTMVNLLVNGAVSGNNSYDGVTFYSASHVIGSPTQAAQTNLYTGTGVTLATIQADFSGAKAQMRKVKDGEGRPMNILADFVLVAPENEQVFSQMLNASFIPAGSISAPMANTFVGQADMGVSPYVTTATWHLLSTKFAMKPLIFQNRKAPEFAGVTDPSAYVVYNHRKFQYGVDCRFAGGYGSWEMAIKVA